MDNYKEIQKSLDRTIDTCKDYDYKHLYQSHKDIETTMRTCKWLKTHYYREHQWDLFLDAKFIDKQGCFWDLETLLL